MKIPEYIEREAAIQAASIWNGDESTEAWIKSALKKLPAADVRPVVHGMWERKRDKCGSFVSCSVCHTSGWYQFAFCPYCGADMRQEEDK